MSLFFPLISLEILGMVFVLALGIILEYKYSLLEFLSFSFLNGLWLIALIQFLFFLLKIKISLAGILILVTCFLAALIILFSKFSDKVVVKDFKVEDIKLYEKLIILAIFVQFVWVILHVLPMPVRSFDSTACFSLKAKIFYLNQGVPLDFFRLNEAAVWHIDYPLLLPFYMSWVYYFIGFNDIAIIRIMPVLYMVFIIFFYALLRKFFNKRYSLACAFVLSAVPQLARFSMVMYADLVLAAFVTVAFLYFMLYLAEENRVYLVFASLLFGISIWVKNEGMVFLPAFLISLVLAERKLRSALLAISIILLVALPWLAFKHYAGLVNTDINMAALSVNGVLKNLKGSLAILDGVQVEVFNPKKWNLLWVITGLVIFLNIKRLFTSKVVYAACFILISITLYFLAYMLTTSYDMIFLSEKTLPRTMIHFCGMFIFLAAYLLYQDKENIFRS